MVFGIDVPTPSLPDPRDEVDDGVATITDVGDDAADSLWSAGDSATDTAWGVTDGAQNTVWGAGDDATDALWDLGDDATDTAVDLHPLLGEDGNQLLDDLTGVPDVDPSKWLPDAPDLSGLAGGLGEALGGAFAAVGEAFGAGFGGFAQSSGLSKWLKYGLLAVGGLVAAYAVSEQMEAGGSDSDD